MANIDMTKPHDKIPGMNETIVTERGQVSVPASLRKAMGLNPGQKLYWEQVSDREIRVILHQEKPPGPIAMLGHARHLRKSPPRSTDDWMRELREAE